MTIKNVVARRMARYECQKCGARWSWNVIELLDAFGQPPDRIVEECFKCGAETVQSRVTH